jgi:hypothetical protein
MSQIFKTLTDLRDIIKDFEGFIARPTTEQMTVEQLVSKLKMLAHRMSVIRNGGKAL